MHQPYYVDLLSRKAFLPWARLHGVKDYLDMLLLLEEYPGIHLNFNVVPSLFEQIKLYSRGRISDRYWELSLKKADKLSDEDKKFIRDHFFQAHPLNMIAPFPRYYELYLKRGVSLNTGDFLDLQVLFNLSWIDPMFRSTVPELKRLVVKGRCYSERDKRVCLTQQMKILRRIIPEYRRFTENGQVELSVTPFYHPILPLLVDTDLARKANPGSILPDERFAFPQDCDRQISEAMRFVSSVFGSADKGMWPSEEAVCPEIMPYLFKNGVKWIVTDESILYKSLPLERNVDTLYRPYTIKHAGKELKVVFRDRNLSDLIGFRYAGMHYTDAVADFIFHLKNIAGSFKDKDGLVTVAMDGENAWEYFRNDGREFLRKLYSELSLADDIKVATVKEYLQTDPECGEIDLSSFGYGSWINADFGKWMGHPVKALGWSCLSEARRRFEANRPKLRSAELELADKQMLILEGSDWFWWLGEEYGVFDELFRLHLRNLYHILGEEIPEYLNKVLTVDKI